MLVTSVVSFFLIVFYYVRNSFGLPFTKQIQVLTNLEKRPNKTNVGNGENTGN